MRSAKVLACLILSAASFAVAAPGCIISDCDNGQDNCIELETPTRYEGQEETLSAPWTSGKAIRVVSANGEVDVRQGSGSDVSATFQPFALDEDTAEDRARRAMEEDLTLEVTDDGGTIVVRAAKASGSSGGLGSDIVVSLPAGFDGAFEVSQGNGSVEVDLSGSTPTSTKVVNDGAGSLTVLGARGKLDIVASTGDVEVDVAAWAEAGENGNIFTDNGDLTLTVPRTANGVLNLTGDTITESGVPADIWTDDGAGTYTMNAGTGATVDATTDFGDAFLFVE